MSRQIGDARGVEQLQDFQKSFGRADVHCCDVEDSHCHARWRLS